MFSYVSLACHVELCCHIGACLSHCRQVPPRASLRKDNASEFSSAGFDVLSQSVFVLNSVFVKTSLTVGF